MPTISLSELKKNAASQMAEQDAYYQSIGFVRQGNQYVKNPSYRQPDDVAKDAVSLENSRLDTLLKQEQLRKAQTDNKATAKAQLSADERAILSFGDSTMQKIGDLEALLNDPNTDTGLSTLVHGNLRKLGFKGGNQQTIDYDIKTKELLAEYVKLISGAAASDKERERSIQPFIPKATDSKEVARRKLENLRRTISAKQAAVKKTTSGYSDEELKSADDFLKGIQ